MNRIHLITSLGLMTCVAFGQADMRARITSEPKLSKQFIQLQRRSHRTPLTTGDTYVMKFRMMVVTESERAWPLHIYAALCAEAKDGVRTWIRPSETSGLKKTGDKEINSSLITGTQSIKITFPNVEGKIIAWRLRIGGRIILDTQSTTPFAEHIMLAKREWTRSGTGNIRGEPFHTYDNLNRQINKLAKKRGVR